MIHIDPAELGSLEGRPVRVVEVATDKVIHRCREVAIPGPCVLVFKVGHVHLMCNDWQDVE
jgi:hypothetical protein